MGILATYLVFTLPLAITLIVLHEAAHYTAAKLYSIPAKLRFASIILLAPSVYIPDEYLDPRKATIIEIAPQTITIVLLVLSFLVADPLISYILRILVIGHIAASFYDFMELYGFLKRYENKMRLSD